MLTAVRREFPDAPLTADANGAYAATDGTLLHSLDAFGLRMLEQPLHYEDFGQHAALARRLTTPLCLDESIRNAGDAAHALDIGACRIVNIKPARVGGPTQAKRVHDVCHQRGIPVWCGGLLETGIGRAHNLAMATLPGFTLPGDLSASDRYWREDVIDPPVRLEADGTIQVPDRVGLGFAVCPERIEAAAVGRWEMLRP
jgi:O-succinylbenzoate synthase